MGETNLKILHKIQRSAELCISGELRTTATEALNTILDLQLLDLLAKSWASATELRLREAKWGFSTVIVHWLYSAIVRPILLYIVWWRSLEKNCNLRILHKILRSAELCISGALRTTVTEALKTILELQPLTYWQNAGHLQQR